MATRALPNLRSTIFALAAALCFVPAAIAQDGMGSEGEESLSLQTASPEEGFALALKLSRKGVTEVQTDKEVLKEQRPIYSSDATSLIAASHVVAVHFQTIAAANDYWRE